MDNVLVDDTVGHEIGARIKSERMRRNISMADFAERIGVGRTTVQNLELNALTVRIGVLRSVCEVLELDPNYVLGLEPRTYVDGRGVVHKAETVDVGLSGPWTRM